MSTIGDRLKALREFKRISQRELGDAIGLAFSSISSIENGRSESPTALKAIADYFKISYEWLLNGEGTTPEGVVVPNRKETAENPYKDLLYQQMRDEIDYLRKIVNNLTGGGVKQNFLKVASEAGGQYSLPFATDTAA